MLTNGLSNCVWAELDHDLRINMRRDQIAITQRGRLIRLEGETPDIASKRIAANVTRQLVDDSAIIEDRMQVLAPRISDNDLAQQFVVNLLEEGAFRHYAIVMHSGLRTELLQSADSEKVIEVRAEDGVVTLTGTCGSLNDRRLAEVLCWWVQGCRRVDNMLEVTPQQQDSDSLLSSAVQMALHADSFVDDTNLRATVVVGIVELSGLLPSESLRRRALRDIWAIPGIWDIYDRTSIGAWPAACA
jgi:osmotically-inducible protein OsmY